MFPLSILLADSSGCFPSPKNLMSWMNSLNFRLWSNVCSILKSKVSKQIGGWIFSSQQIFPINWNWSCPHTHQQQGCTERKHRHIIDTTLALLSDSGVPKRFWDEECQTSCYLINCLPTPILQHLSPFQKLFGRPPYYYLKKFSCQCFPNLRPYNTYKFEFRSKACIFMGNSSHQKGYRCYHLETEKFFISRDVVESVFPFSFPTSSHMSHSTSPSTQNEPYLFSTTALITVSIQFRVHVSPRTYGPSPSTSPTADPIMNIDPHISPLSFALAWTSNPLAGSSASTSGSC